MYNLSVHICFFYDEQKLKNLYKNIENILEYKNFANKDIFIHTNKKINIDNTNIIVHDVNKLQHPWLLTWCHRPLVKEQLKNYDIFMYLEDDIMYPENSINYWIEYNNILKNTQYDVGFCLLEVDDKNQEYFVSMRINEKCNNKIKINNIDYIELKRNYKASWIYHSNYLQKLDNNFFNIPLNFWKNCRVEAARGKQKPEKNTIVPLINNFYHENCKIYHLSNKYYKIKNKYGYGQVKFKNSLEI